jgi:hypothetical protein
MQEPQQATDVPAEPAANNFMATLLRATWLAILLGIVMEALPLLFAAGFGSSPGPRLPRRKRDSLPRRLRPLPLLRDGRGEAGEL